MTFNFGGELAVGQKKTGREFPWSHFWDYLNSHEEHQMKKGREENSYEWKESGKAEGGGKGKRNFNHRNTDP